MARTVLPLRFRILQYASTVAQFNYLDLMRDLKAEYGGDGQFKRKMLVLHMDSLRAVGMIEEVDVQLENEQADLLITYKITDYGTSRLVYLPAEWK